jgi:hypothetical protein
MRLSRVEASFVSLHACVHCLRLLLVPVFLAVTALALWSAASLKPSKTLLQLLPAASNAEMFRLLRKTAFNR